MQGLVLNCSNVINLWFVGRMTHCVPNMVIAGGGSSS